MNRLYPLILAALLLVGATTATAQIVTISGTVTEANSGEAITGATVALFRESDSGSAKPVRGGISNRFGFYSIPKVAPGRYRLVARSIGSQQRAQSILIPESGVPTLVETEPADTTAADTTATECRMSFSADSSSPRLNICLQPKGFMGREVVVTDRRYDATISTIAIDPLLSQKLPSLGGEPDIMRTLQLLPGIKAGSEISSGLHIRGGSPDQNLILLDGVTVYNPSHIGGFLSTFNSDAIRDVKVMKGVFPAEYGGRLSGVVDMTMREGTQEKFSGTAGISLLNSRLTVEGPISDDITFMVSGRRMYMDLAMQLAGRPEDVPDYYFYDLNGKLNWRLSESDHLFVSGYFGRDDFKTDPRGTDQMLLNWGNATGNIRWSHIISPTMFTNFSAIFTNYDCSTTLMDLFNGSASSGFRTSSQIRDLTLRGEAQIFAGEDHIIKTGFEATEHQFKANATDVVTELEKIANPASLSGVGGVEGGFFLQDEWQITPRLQANIGTRASYFSYGDYLRIEPRVSLAYSISDNVTARGGYSAHNQYLHMITRNDVALPTDIWFPATSIIKPATSQQIAAGVETRLFNNEVLLSVEGYYKTMDNLLEFKDTASFSLVTPLESSFAVGSGKAYGVEFFLNKQVGSFTGWIGYTLSWTDRTFADLNRGKTFFPRFDRRHDISVVATYELSDSWEVGATWVYATGQATTVPQGQFIYGTREEDSYAPESRYDFSERNGYRLPAFHKLDLNFSHKYQWFNLPFTLSLNVYNAYNRQNVFSQAVDKESVKNEITGESYEKHTLKRVTLFPTLLTVGLSCKF